MIAQGRAGSKVDQIEFITNEGEVFGPFGGSGGDPFVSSHPGGRKLLNPSCPICREVPGLDLTASHFIGSAPNFQLYFTTSK